MSLDSFMGRSRPKPAPKPPPVPKEETAVQKARLQKRVLKCPNAKCKYEKVVVKAKLLRNDLTCPKCGTLMKEHEPRQSQHQEAPDEGEA